MIIKKKRIRSLSTYLNALPVETFVVGVRATLVVRTSLPSLGFSSTWTDGETLLPPASGGSSCRRNAEGWDIVHKDRPKETAYREFDWSWEEFHGPYREERSKTVYQSYERYPRTHVLPPSLELCTVSSPEGKVVVFLQTFEKSGDLESAKLAVNVLLELFGEAELLSEDLSALTPSTLRRLNWEILPQGEHPWETLEPAVRNLLEVQGERKRPVFERRWSDISTYEPDFVAVGRAGFTGYLIFGFTARDLYVLESAYYGNATYVLDGNWESLSRLTKAELLDGALHRDRIIHRDGWDERIRDLLGSRRRAV